MTPEGGEAVTKKVNVKRQLVDHEVGPRSSQVFFAAPHFLFSICYICCYQSLEFSPNSSCSTGNIKTETNCKRFLPEQAKSRNEDDVLRVAQIHRACHPAALNTSVDSPVVAEQGHFRLVLSRNTHRAAVTHIFLHKLALADEVYVRSKKTLQKICVMMLLPKSRCKKRNTNLFGTKQKTSSYQTLLAAVFVLLCHPMAGVSPYAPFTTPSWDTSTGVFSFYLLSAFDNASSYILYV